MAGVFRLLELEYNDETNFAENAQSLNTNTFGTRIPVIDYALNLNQERIANPEIRSRMNEEGLSNSGIRVATIEIETYLAGHLTTTSGSLTQTWLHKLLSDGFGGSNVAANGTTVSAATSGSSVTFTATTGWAAGMIGWLGAKGDAKGDGQAFVVNSVGTPVTFLTALAATPAASDVIYAGQQLYHDESVAQTLTTKRFQCGYSSTPTSGAQFQVLGCQLAGVDFKFPMGDIPRVRLKYIGAYWGRNGVTIPSASPTIKDQFAAPTAAGRFFINSYGTATSAVDTPSEVTLSINLGLEPIIGPGGAGTYQNIVGWTRTMAQPTLTVKLPWQTAYETWFDTANQSFVYKHILFNCNVVDGRRVAFYLPKVFPVGNRPSQPVESNRQLYVPITFRGTDDTSGATELTKSAFRMALG